MAIDLSAASDDGLALILLRVPVRDLIGQCTQVSPQWNRILSDNFFWRKKMEYDGYVLEWPKLVGLSLKSFQWMALKHCFKRNFLKDSWNLQLQNEQSLILDPRWVAGRIIWPKGDCADSYIARIEIPPAFLDGQPEMPTAYDKPIPACIAIAENPLINHIVIKLADEGLTDEIMDKFRPTIVVTELVGNRRDCAAKYVMKCCLEVSGNLRGQFFKFPHKNERELIRDENDQWIAQMVTFHFRQGRDEGWHRMEINFKDYPAGMRYLHLFSAGSGNGHGLKLANCSVKALCEKNAN